MSPEQRKDNEAKFGSKHKLTPEQLELLRGPRELQSEPNNIVDNQYKNIIGNVCFHYENTHGFDEDVLVQAAINKYFPDNPEDTIVILNSVDPQSMGTKAIYQSLKRYFSGRRDIVLMPTEDTGRDAFEDVKVYLRDPKGILVTDMNSFHGAHSQARNAIMILRESSKYPLHFRKQIMRTMAFCIIIHFDKKPEKEAVPGLVQHMDLHELKHIQPKSKTRCYHYQNSNLYVESELILAILRRYNLNLPNESTLVLTFNSADKICKEFEKKSHFFNNKEIICLPGPLYTGDGDQIAPEFFMGIIKYLIEKPALILVIDMVLNLYLDDPEIILKEISILFEKFRHIIYINSLNSEKRESEFKSEIILKLIRNVIMKSKPFFFVNGDDVPKLVKPYILIEEVS